jgi:hypothetical protein
MPASAGNPPKAWVKFPGWSELTHILIEGDQSGRIDSAAELVKSSQRGHGTPVAAS